MGGGLVTAVPDLSAGLVLRRAADLIGEHPESDRLRRLVQQIEAAGSRGEVILAAARIVDARMGVVAQASRHPIPYGSYPHAPEAIRARLVLGETPAQISGGLTRREAHRWLLNAPDVPPAEWLLYTLGTDRSVLGDCAPRSVGVARWLLAVLSDPPRRRALLRSRTERGPHGEEATGRLVDHAGDLIDRDLRPSVEATFERAGRRLARAAARLAVRHREPLAAVPRWWRSARCARLLLSAADLTAEGRELDHCVGQYAGYVRAGKSVIVSLRVLGHPSTVEIDRASVRVLQHRGPRNATPHALCDRALTVLVRRWRRAAGVP